MITTRATNGRRVVTQLLKALIGVALALVVVLSVSPAHAASSSVTWTRAKVTRWVDGDTVVTTHGEIRLIGVDTPERGRCGAGTATKWAKKWAPVGSTVRLGNPKSVKNRDRYGRALRYVVRGKIDVSKHQIIKGARARYDSRDGYQWHPRQSRYHKADGSHGNYACKSTTPNDRKSTKPTGRNCPKSAPIKGNESSMIYHMPGQQYYKVTVPEACFSTERQARAAGYRKAKI